MARKKQITDLYTELHLLAVEAGSNITEVCRRADICRDTLSRWKYEKPSTLKVIDRYKKAAAEIKKEKSK